MSSDDRERDRRDDGEQDHDFEADAGSDQTDALGDDSLDDEGAGGLGLTEEFARIEAEIQGEEQEPGTAPEPAAAEGDPEPVEQAPGETVEADALAFGREDDPEGLAGEAEVSDGSEDGGTEVIEPGPDAAEGDAEGDPDDDEDEAFGEGEPEDDAEDDSDADAEADESPEEIPESSSGQNVGQTVVRPGPPTEPALIPIARAPQQPATPPIAEEDLKDRTPSLWWRFASASVVIVATVAASVAAGGLLFFESIAADLTPIPGIKQQLKAIESDEAQTILIVGSDKREGEPTLKGDPGRSDTTMLLRVDPDNKVLSLFSLPRDLKVFIPGIGESKLNEAYSAGGLKKTLKTVKSFTGLEINHVVEINFQGFAEAVNAIECVYVDVDRDYFNDNSIPGQEQYAAIDINAGYQRLCGLKALQYVRYRHNDTDLVRAARQQDFLREARQKVEPRELLPGFGNGNELIDIFTKYTDSDIDEADQIIGVLKSFVAVVDVPVNEVHFEGDIGGPDDPFVTSTDAQVEKAIKEFLGGGGTGGQRGGEKSNEKVSSKPKGEKKKKKKDKEEKLSDAVVQSTGDVADEKTGTLDARLEKDGAKNARRLGIPTFYPTKVVPGSSFSTDSRTYEYENEDNDKVEAYKTVIAYTTPSTLTEYYGIEGTTWDDPPIMRNPSEVRKIDGRDYDLFYDGDRLRMVGWHEDGNTYWLNNTLTQSIGEAEMLAIATSIKQA